MTTAGNKSPSTTNRQAAQSADFTSKTKKATKKVYESSLNLLLNRDYFGDTFTMRIDSGNTDLKSYMGAFMSLFVLAILQLFTYLKAETLILKKDVDILSTV